MTRASSIERACDALLVVFGAWTLACNAVVLAGGSLVALVPLGALAVAGAWWLTRRHPLEARGAEAHPAASAPPSKLRPWAVACALLATLAAVLAAASGTATWLPWSAVVAGLVASAWAVRAAPIEVASAPIEVASAPFEVASAPFEVGSAPVESAAGERLVLAAALVLAALALCMHRGSPDDGFYVNVAAHAAARPTEPLLRHDTLHGIEGLPLMYSVYRLHSFELLGAAVAFVTRLPAVRVMHTLAPLLVALFAVLAQARLCRRLVPGRWVLATLVAVTLVVLEGETPQSLGSFGTLRLHQGKTALLVVLLPLVLCAAADFARRPGRGAFLRLFLAQVASVGASATALWAAPAVAGLGLIAGAPWTRHGARRVALGLAASAHPLLAGALLVARTRAESALELARTEGVQLVASGNEVYREGGPLVAVTWRTVLGDGSFALVALGALGLAWLAASERLGRRLAVVLPLGFLLVLANPLTAVQVAEYVTGGPTYWRVFWVLPLPALLALLVSAPWQLNAPRAVAVGATLLLAVALGWGVLGGRGLTQGVTWSPLGMSLPAEALEHARGIAADTPAGSRMIGPRQVGTTLLQIDGTRTPLVSLRNWLNIQRHRIGAAETDRRLRLLDYLIGLPQPGGEQLLAEAVQRDELAAVSFVRGTFNTRAIRATVTRLGFRLELATKTLETWVR